MRRAILLVALVGLVAFAFAWIADRPGTVAITWQGWQIDAPIGMLFAAAAVLVFLSVAFYALLRWLIRLPGEFIRGRRERRRRRGYAALTRGLVAVAAGDPSEARRQSRRAQVLLDEPPLTLLLSAQAAQLAEELGLRGLLTQALRTGNHAEALTLVRRARTLQPQTPWVLTTLFELEARAGDWDAAIDAVRRAARLGVLPPAKARRSEAAALIERARVSRGKNRPQEALGFAKQAYGTEPTHPAAAATLAQALIDANRPRKAARLIEQEWPRQPHPELVAIYRRALTASDPVEWTLRVAGLAKLAPEARESKIALAQAALAARLWGEARRYLAEAMSMAPPSAGLARMMARIEAGEHDDVAAERRWLAQAAEALPDPAWVCEECGFAHRVWQANCERCHAFDTQVWRSPDRVQPILDDVLPPAPPPRPSAGALVPVNAPPPPAER